MHKFLLNIFLVSTAYTYYVYASIVTLNPTIEINTLSTIYPHLSHEGQRIFIKLIISSKNFSFLQSFDLDSQIISELYEEYFNLLLKLNVDLRLNLDSDLTVDEIIKLLEALKLNSNYVYKDLGNCLEVQNKIGRIIINALSNWVQRDLYPKFIDILIEHTFNVNTTVVINHQVLSLLEVCAMGMQKSKYYLKYLNLFKKILSVDTLNCKVNDKNIISVAAFQVCPKFQGESEEAITLLINHKDFDPNYKCETILSIKANLLFSMALCQSVNLVNKLIRHPRFCLLTKDKECNIAPALWMALFQNNVEIVKILAPYLNNPYYEFSLSGHKISLKQLAKSRKENGEVALRIIYRLIRREEAKKFNAVVAI